MVKFAHMADVHLGGWKQQPMQELNFQSFIKSIDRCILEKIDFLLIAGDLFDTAFPGMDVLKETFFQFRRLKEAGIPCFIIAGSHDYSVSGKTFLDVLEKAGFCENVACYEEKEGRIVLNPTIYKGVALYGFPGKKSGLEVQDLKKVKLNDSPGLFKIFMLHTTLDKAKGTLPVDSVEADLLPKADYYALGHLHIDFQYQNFVYPGPIFPNNFQELEDLQYGSFYIVDTSSLESLRKITIPTKERVLINIELKSSIGATEKIISEMGKKDIEDKIVLLRIKGDLETGRHSDINFQKIDELAKSKKAYFTLKNTHELKLKEAELEIDVANTENIEDETIKVYSENNPSKFNALTPQLISSFSMEKQEGETAENFSKRLLEAAKKILGF